MQIEEGGPREVGEHREPLGRQVVMTAKALRAYFEARLAEAGASLPTYLVLEHARRDPSLSQRWLAGQIGVEAPTLTRHLDRMEAEGLVIRRRHERDRRQMRVELTDRGRDCLARIEEVHSRLDGQLWGLMSDDEQRLLRDLLARIHRHVTDVDLREENDGSACR